MNVTSYSGFFTVEESTDSNMFFWFINAIDKDVGEAPVVIWLQGGPGSSSMFGLFGENGPYSVSSDLKLLKREHTWSKWYSMLYIDNPVGTGFSFTNSTAGYSTNEVEVGKNLYSLLDQFYQVFPNLRTNDLYITGESYAGKYVPSFAYTVHEMNKKVDPKLQMNLKGISIGDGIMSPLKQMPGYADLAYAFGLADRAEYEVILDYERVMVNAIERRDFRGAFEVFDEMLNGDFYPYGTYFLNITGNPDYFNILRPDYPPNPYPDFLDLNTTKEAIHVGEVKYWDGNSTVERYLIDDFMDSVEDYVVTLLENYKVLIYNGQLDFILSGSQAQNFLNELEWSGRERFLSAKKIIWKVDKNDREVAGYVKNVENFWQVIVTDAGHLLPLDQPRSAADMIHRFIEGLPFTN